MLDALDPGARRRSVRPLDGGGDTPRSSRGHGRCGRGRRRRDDPAAGDQGPRVVSRRALDRPPGPRGDLGGAAAARPGRRDRRRRAERGTGRSTRTMATRTVLVGRAGSPGVGLGWLLLRRRRAERRRPPAASPPSTGGPIRPRGGARCRARPGRGSRPSSTALAAATTARAGEEVGAIFEAQALFARDPGIVDPALARDRRRTGRGDGHPRRSRDEQAEQLAAVDDEYFRERAADVRDVGRRDRRPRPWRVAAATCGTPTARPAILVADGPRPVGRRRAAAASSWPGIALAGGAPTGHAAIVARGAGDPPRARPRAGRRAAWTDAEVAVDGGPGGSSSSPTRRIASLLARRGHRRRSPTASTCTACASSPTSRRRRRPRPPRRPGRRASAWSAPSCSFLGRNRRRPSPSSARPTPGSWPPWPDRPVVFRTLDIGGDKPAAWQAGRAEANPALGVRGVRLGPARPALLDDQLRALVEAAGEASCG